MRLKKIICICGLSIILLIIGSRMSLAATVVDGKIARDHLKRTVHALLYQEKYDVLEKMAKEFRQTKARFPEGAWKLSFFYKAFNSPQKSTSEGWKQHIKKLAKWMDKYPDSITARVASASAWMYFGWDARGKGNANTVSGEGWTLLAERMKKSYVLLESPPVRQSDDCPERYLLFLLIANVEGWNEQKYESLFNKAIAFEPAYYDYYLNKAGHLMPRWHGSVGDWQKFADQAVKLTPKAEGISIYTRIVWSMWLEKEFSSFNASGISWAKMKQGFIDIERNYPDSPWNLNSFCMFACLAGDKETAIRLFKRIGNKPYVEVWNGRGEYERWREWAGVVVPRDKATLTEIYRHGETEDFNQMLELAKQGDPDAQYKVGINYNQDERVARDYKEAAKWFRKAAEQEFAAAQSALGVLYANGNGVKQDYKEAVKWYRAAAEQGDFSGMFFLGIAYYEGKGVPKDYIKAYVWFSQYPNQTKDMLEDIRKTLLPTQLKDAEKEALKLKKELTTKF
ncbi:MAG: tetratricopeptide repeat protein [Thermodesulfovibrionales bacterium]